MAKIRSEAVGYTYTRLPASTSRHTASRDALQQRLSEHWAYHLLELSQRREVLVRKYQSAAAGFDNDMRGAYINPGLHEIDPVCWALASDAHAPFQGESSGVTPRCFGILMHPRDEAFAISVSGDIRGPAVSEARHTAQDSLWGLRILIAAHPKPDGDRTLHRQRIQASMGNVMPLAVEVHDLLRPQGPQYGNLLGAPTSPGVEVLVQGFI